ncbi:MAG: oligosaccharide flippase family protein [Candidatus Zixiibacteriota bacterium]|nr:MAG: oligosaccharide flippase family protein [candidate division Zixibacteria bacterium]
MRRLFSNTAMSGLDTFILVALNLLATPILIKNFGAAEYGVFIFLSIFTTYGFLSFLDLGMEGSLLNYVARFEAEGNRRRIQDSLTIAVLFYGSIGLLIGLALFFLADFVDSRFIDDTGALQNATVLTAIQIVSANVFVLFLSLPFRAVLQGLRRFVITKSVDAAMTTARYLLLIGVAVYFRRIDYAFLVILGLSILKLVVLIAILGYRLPYFRSYRLRFDLATAKSLFSYSTILIISRIIGFISNQMDKFLIWLYLAVTQMAIYDVVVRPGHLIRMIISVINSAIIPEVAFLHQKKDTEAIRRLFVNLVRYAYLIILPLMAVLFPHMESLLKLWVGAEFSPHYYIAWVLLAAFLLAPVPSIASTMLVGMELVRQTIWIPITATIINVVFSLVLMKLLGLVGLVLGTLAAEIFLVSPYLSVMKRHLQLRSRHITGPVSRIVIVAVLFAALNTLLVNRGGGDFLPWLPVVAVLAAAHYVVNYRFLLDAGERRFVLSKIRGAETAI